MDQQIQQAEETEESALDSPRRRRMMAAGAATWASVSVAGCMGLLDDNENGDDNNDDGDDDEGPRNYVVTDDMIAGSEGIPEAAGGFAQACSPQSQFVPGMQAVFKIGVWDPETGDILTDDSLDEVVVDLDRGETIELEFDDEDEEWSGNWVIPDDEDTGTVGFTVEVTNDGEYHHVGVLESEFEIIEFDGAQSYVVTTDLYTGSSGIPEDNAGGFAQSCSPQRTFARGMMVGFEVGVYDPASGEMIDDEVVDEATVSIDAAGGVDLDLEWDDEDGYWSAAWHGTEDADPGTIPFTVEVTNDAEFQRVGAQEDEFELIDYE